MGQRLQEGPARRGLVKFWMLMFSHTCYCQNKNK